VGQKRNHLVINGVPWKSGLMTFGHQQDIPETALWQATNVGSGLDGVMSKRPGLRQWGQTIKVPDAAATGSTTTTFNDFISTTGALVSVDTSGADITSTRDKSYLQFNVPALASTNSLTYYYPGTSASTDWGFRILLQGTNLPEYVALSTTPNSLRFRVIAAAGTGKEFVLWLGGLYYKRASDDTYVLIDGTELMGQGGWNCIEILCDDGGGNTLIYNNETLVATLLSSTLKDVTLNAGALWEVTAQYASGAVTAAYNARIGTPMYNDTNLVPFKTVPMRNLVAAAGDYIYVDRGELVWRPLHPKQRVDVFFTTYQRTLIWSDNDGGGQASLWKWTGLAVPELLTAAPAFLFMTEHQQRLAGVSRENPLTVLISADRNPNQYVDPDHITPSDDLFDVLLDAVMIPIPAKRSDVITAIWGDYYGSLIIWTTSSVWRLTGNGVFSYALSNISQSVGCINSKCIVMFGNDLWFAGSYGIHSLQATDQFGDIQVQYPSIAIQSMWQQSNQAPIHVNRQNFAGARMAHYRSRGLIYAYFPVLGIMTYNTTTKEWHGPWSIESAAMESVEVVSPLTEFIMHGFENGKIGYTDYGYKADFGSEYTATWESAYLNGRSLDPSLIGMRKTWRLLRLYFLPRGNWDYTVSWYASIEDQISTVTSKQLETFPAFTVSTDMRVSVTPDGQVYSAHELHIAEIELEVTGYSLNFKIQQAGVAQDLVPVGFQVEFDADGYEVE